MDELQLLRDYVQTMQRQIQSKNQQIRTLTEQNQKLIRQNQALSMKKSFVLNSTVACGDCDKFKRELYEAETRERSLQVKYDSLQKQGRASSVRVVTNSSNCTDCAKSKRDLQQLKSKYNELQKANTNLSRLSTSSTRVYSSCSQCPRLRQQIKSKDQQITQLQSQLSALTIKSLSMQSQLTTLNATKLVVSQPINRSNDLDRIAYLNNQVEQYLALVNSLRSEIKVLNEESQRYAVRVRELESRPREVQYVEKELSWEIKEEMRALKVEIGELSSDNMLLRRENANLKRQIMNLQKTQPIIIQKIPQRPLSPVQFQPRPSRHFRKSNIVQKSYQTLPYPGISSQKLPYPQKTKYQDYERKIQLLQMQNDMLKGTFYSEI